MSVDSMFSVNSAPRNLSVALIQFAYYDKLL